MPTNVIFILLMLLGVLLRFYGLGRSLGGADENEFLLFWGYSPIEFLLTHYDDGGHQVFHTLLVRLMILGFGEENAIAIRFPAFFFGIAGLWMVYLLSRQLFRSQWTARLALFFAAVSSIHIHYSQTARGYSFIVFFSAVMIYAAIRLLESGQHWKWGALLTLCGFLSVYTIPTNVYFAMALAGWVFLVLLVPGLRGDFGIKTAARNGFLTAFTAVFFTMALLSLLGHWPFIRVMEEAAREYYTPRVESSILKLSYEIVQGVFQGPLQWFLPFLVAGVVWGKVFRPAYRLFPVFIFLVPFAVNLVLGFTGFARNYLFNWPLFMIFLAAGLVWAGEFLEKKLNLQNRKRPAVIALVVLYSLASLKVMVFDHYPSIQMSDGNLYAQKVKEHSGSHDLVIIADGRNYLYGRPVVRENLKNIILENKITGVHLIAKDFPVFDRFKIADAGGEFEIFRNVYSAKNLEVQDVSGDRMMFGLTGAKSISVLPEDFEADSQWMKVSGLGKVSSRQSDESLGGNSLQLQANQYEDLLVEAVLPGQINLPHDSLVILVWVGSPRIPTLVIRNHQFYDKAWSEPGKSTFFRYFRGSSFLRAGELNPGLNIRFQSGKIGARMENKMLFTSLGFIRAGKFGFNMRLFAQAGETLTYDGFRLFFIETAPAKGKEDFSSPPMP